MLYKGKSVKHKLIIDRIIEKKSIRNSFLLKPNLIKKRSKGVIKKITKRIFKKEKYPWNKVVIGNKEITKIITLSKKLLIIVLSFEDK